MNNEKEFREKLTAKHIELSGRVARITKNVRHVEEPLDADFAEQAVERENDEVHTALDDSIRAELTQIEQSLMRLDEGTYGLCANCGNPIGEKRLAALPYATQCVTCAA